MKTHKKNEKRSLSRSLSRKYGGTVDKNYIFVLLLCLFTHYNTFVFVCQCKEAEKREFFCRCFTFLAKKIKDFKYIPGKEGQY